MAFRQTDASKTMSYLLRHGARKEGLAIGDDGFVLVSELLNHMRKTRKFQAITQRDVLDIASADRKGRYVVEWRDNESFISAAQGHSMNLKIEMETITHASQVPVAVHGTYTQHWESIKATGLHKRSRQHVHFGVGDKTQSGEISGMRNSCNLEIHLDVAHALSIGLPLLRSQNNVILSPGFDGVVPPSCFARVVKIPEREVWFDVQRDGRLADHLSGESKPAASTAVQPQPQPQPQPQKAHSTARRARVQSAYAQEGPTKVVPCRPPPPIQNGSATSRSEGQGGSSAPSEGFEYLCVLDFEATCDDRVKLKPQEIIEFPCVLLDTTTWQNVAEFHQYVRPVFNPTLSKFCTELTGIEQHTVDSANTFLQVLEDFQQWMCRPPSEGGAGLWDRGTNSPLANFTFVTCGQWDLNTMLPHQSKASGVDVPKMLRKFINIKDAFNCVYGTKKIGMDGMLKTMELPLVGRHHSGIDDTRNIANLCVHLHKTKPNVFSRDLEMEYLPSKKAKNMNRQ